MRKEKRGPPSVAGKAVQESRLIDEEAEHSGETDSGQAPPDSSVEKKLRKLKGKHRDQTQGDRELRSYLARNVAYWMDDCMTMPKTKEHYRKTGRIVIYPSQKKIAQQVGCFQSEVSRAMKPLIDNGHYRLSDDPSIGPLLGGGRRNDEYEVLIKPHPKKEDRYEE